MIETTSRNHFSNCLIPLYTGLIFEKEKLINQAKIMTGKPVAIANTRGKYNPELEATVSGISIPKNNTPLYGQKAKAKTTPSKNELPKSHEVFCCIFWLIPLKIEKLKLNTPNISIPIRIRNGPMNFSPHV